MTYKILNSDVYAALNQLSDNSIDVAVTSPHIGDKEIMALKDKLEMKKIIKSILIN